ncbi:MAG TPA: glycosyltransferase family 4 protein [Humibacter sp.]|nr:glycosyltransferase family 4 protein [Humibacter sp.]
MHPNPTVFFVVPDSFGDAERVSGGNVYDQRIRDGLRADGWAVRMMVVADGGRGRFAGTLCQLPDAALVLVDGLLVSCEPDALVRHGSRLRPVVLAHMATARVTERVAFRVADRVIATSDWTRDELIAQDAADPHRIVVAHPGADPAQATTASASGGRLLCVAAVAPHKGQDLLVRALADFVDLDHWTCTFVGSLQVVPDFVAELTAAISSAGLTDRIAFTGPLAPRALDEVYARADLVITPSRRESYGMVVAEALARGIPVLASATGGIPEAIAGSEAGMIVPPEEPRAIATVLRQWWASSARRGELKEAAMKAREAVRPWSTTTAIVASALAEAAGFEAAPARPAPASRALPDDVLSAEGAEAHGARAGSARRS